MSEKIVLTPGEQARIRNGVKRRGFEFTKNKLEAARLFREIYHDIKIRFHVDSYKYVKRSELQSVIRYIERWKPNKAS